MLIKSHERKRKVSPNLGANNLSKQIGKVNQEKSTMHLELNDLTQRSPIAGQGMAGNCTVVMV